MKVLQPTLTLPFDLRGYSGKVTVFYGVNEDPEYWGFGFLNLPFPLEFIKGFPVCEARIDYEGQGYTATMGWIQLITVKDRATSETWVAIDQMPNQDGIDVPFTPFGHLPTMFDAPGPNPPRSDETWLAETFLVACPDVARTRTVEVVTGFSWGYELEAMKATSLPAQGLELAAWNKHLPYLKQTFPSWTFSETPA